MPVPYVPLDTGRYEAAMTFEEIAAALGISRQRACSAYISGIRKLRRKGVRLEKLREMARELEQQRDRREGAGAEW
jgi:hypothetical protein